MKKILFFLTLLLPLAASQPKQNAGRIRLEIVGFKNDKGQVLINLFSSKSAKGFPSDPKAAFKSAVIEKIENGQASIEFEQVPFGDYAIALIHDENLNNELDTNLLGIPKEGYAFSNNYRPRVRAPRFKDAAFTLNRSSKSLRLEVIY
jgi:uncharacterized protein (DUF2141 family)